MSDVKLNRFGKRGYKRNGMLVCCVCHSARIRKSNVMKTCEPYYPHTYYCPLCYKQHVKTCADCGVKMYRDDMEVVSVDRTSKGRYGGRYGKGTWLCKKCKNKDSPEDIYEVI